MLSTIRDDMIREKSQETTLRCMCTAHETFDCECAPMCQLDICATSDVPLPERLSRVNTETHHQAAQRTARHSWSDTPDANGVSIDVFDRTGVGTIHGRVESRLAFGTQILQSSVRLAQILAGKSSPVTWTHLSIPGRRLYLRRAWRRPDGSRS